MNELAKFNFFIQYHPVKENVIADILIQPSSNNHLQCMKACTKLILADQVKAILDGTESKYNSINNWSACLKTAMVKEQQRILHNLTTPTKCFTVNDLQKGQQVKYWISRVKNIIKGKVSLTKACKKKATRCLEDTKRTL